jgi:phosphoribosylanthranilate isomerase
LNPVNVGDAIVSVRPFAVDVSTGVEQSPGVKSHDAIRAFVKAVRTVDGAINPGGSE